MPELPEVQRATNALKERSVNKTIINVETSEDKIVFADGITHEDFAKELLGRKVLDVLRYGKVFYFNLDGEGRLPVLHFGMTGNIHIKGSSPLQYKEGPKKPDVEWPPRFMKFIMHLSSDGETADTEIAFIDPRRLARIRLCNKPMDEPPISSLGFDPILSMPPLHEFSNQVLKRGCPIKALLLDQSSFSAGIGNWVSDEILYHARVHPEQKCNTLGEGQVKQVYEKMKYVCETAVSLNAESTKFPKHWLFNHRWGKGKRKDQAAKLLLESGEAATIKWITVGGRTSAYVVELQKRGGGHGVKEESEPKEDQSSVEAATMTAEQPTTTSRSTRSKRTIDAPAQSSRQKRRKT